MRNLQLFAVGLVLLAAWVPCHAQQRPVTAVIPSQAEGVSAADAHGLTVLFEAALQNTGRFTVIEQTQMESVLKAQETSEREQLSQVTAVSAMRIG